MKIPNTNESCKPQVLNRVHCGPFQANVCMKSLTEETVSQNDYLVYEFEIDAEPTGSDVTYKYDHFYTIKCLYVQQRENWHSGQFPAPAFTDSF